MSLPARDVLLCRDCCCGSGTKHPDTDHAAQRAELLACATTPTDGGVRVRVVECLDECDRSNVVLVRDFTAGRRPHDTWLGGVVSDAATADVVSWVRDGGPLPDALRGHVFPRGRA